MEFSLAEWEFRQSRFRVQGLFWASGLGVCGFRVWLGLGVVIDLYSRGEVCQRRMQGIISLGHVRPRTLSVLWQGQAHYNKACPCIGTIWRNRFHTAGIAFPAGP